MAKKKTARTARHKSFQITPPKPTYGKIFFYMVVAGSVGMTIGMYFGNQVVVALANYVPVP